MMMKTRHVFNLALLLTILISLPGAQSAAWEPYDRVLAVVNTIPIIESEVNNKLAQLKKLKRMPGKDAHFDKSRVLDRFIENVLVDETADNESIIISQKKILLHMEGMLKQFFSNKFENPKELDVFITKISERLRLRLNDEVISKKTDLDVKLDEFINYIQKTELLDFTAFVSEIRNQMKRELIMSISIGISPPSRQEITDWFNKNKKMLGFEVRVKHILVMPRNNSLEEERRANGAILDILKRVRSGESFDALAARYSDDKSSAVKGGDIGWVNIATLDPYFAGHVYQMTRYGDISEVFKSGYGYHIVQYLGRRDVTFDRVERLIVMKLYNEKMMMQFKKWVQQRKKESAIKIYMDNYVKGEGDFF